MKVIRINHIGVAPKDNAVAASFFGDVLGLARQGEETVAEQKVHVRFFQAENSRIELLEATSPDSPIAKFIEARGAGIQHFALEVDDIAAWVTHLKTQGVRLIDETPRSGAHDTLIAFIHPASTGGVLVELVQEKVQA
jgi:methylmalonyl-CoA/ethylmalonyl-CoA epimerase